MIRNSMKVIEAATKEYRAQLRAGAIKCSCGGPACGTDHAPDCELEFAWDRIIADERQKEYESSTEE